MMEIYKFYVPGGVAAIVTGCVAHFNVRFIVQHFRSE